MFGSKNKTNPQFTCFVEYKKTSVPLNSEASLFPSNVNNLRDDTKSVCLGDTEQTPTDQVYKPVQKPIAILISSVITTIIRPRQLSTTR